MTTTTLLKLTFVGIALLLLCSSYEDRIEEIQILKPLIRLYFGDSYSIFDFHIKQQWF
jgi:hypothetical protein